MTLCGTVSLIVPGWIRARADFVEDSALYWLRAVRQDDVVRWSPAVRGIVRNTVLAAHHVTLENEVLGSSHAAPGQVFAVLRPPILDGELLQVREAESASDIERLLNELPPDAIEIDSLGAVWARWHAVSDLAQSTSDDRHYAIDRQNGKVQFGDGRRGRIPPLGSNNIRLRRYQTGGGSRGNKRPETITQLRTALPFVESVTNLVAASGGVDFEDTTLVRQRGATALRHRGRAVTSEDYEDLARLASAEVGRSHSVPLRDLAVEPSLRRKQPGIVSVVIVPRSEGPKPEPDIALLRHVRSYLDRYRNPATELVVVGPDYVHVGVEMEAIVSESSDAGTTARELEALLEKYLHPLHGGPAGHGWRFGELPERGDVYGLYASVQGVAYLSSLRVVYSEDRAGAIGAGDFLVCSGSHTIGVRRAADHASHATSAVFTGTRA